jgi:hypothetical protein
MKTSEMKVLSLFALLVVTVLVSASFVAATWHVDNKQMDKKPVIDNVTECGNNGFNCECQNFYNDSHYYTIEKWSFNSCKKDYVLEEENTKYKYYNINVDGNLKGADWTSSPEVVSVLVKAGKETVEFDGGLSGSVNTTKKDISHITFCGYKSNDGGCTGSDCGSNGVPEFPKLSVVAAVLVVALGIVFLRKN